MNRRTVRIAYWTSTGAFAVAMRMDGLGGIRQAEAGKESVFLAITFVSHYFWKQYEAVQVAA